MDFFIRLLGFVGQNALLRAATAPSFGTPCLFATRSLSFPQCVALSLDFVQKLCPSQDPVLPLMSGGLAFDLHPRRSMEQHNARRYLIDILTAVPAGSHEMLLQIGLGDSQSRHPPLQEIVLTWINRQRAHGQTTTMSPSRIANGNCRLDGTSADSAIRREPV